ncbi:VOC family protein [Embleya sp. NPDC001921]
MAPAIRSVDQLGYVVDDVEAAMRHWSTSLGVGPFFHFPQAAIRETYYRGEPTDARIAVGIAYAGDRQIELIQQLNPDAPSAYRDFRREHGEGLHHLGHFTTDYDAYLAEFARAGVHRYHHGTSGPGGRFAYFPTEAHGGTVVEALEVTLHRDFFAMIREAARTWDGESAPIRELDFG